MDDFVFEDGGKYQVDLGKRLLNFSVKIFELLEFIPYKKEFDVFRYQLSKSSTSIGANIKAKEKIKI